jgi:peptide/nickel transport system ATP-binding protein
MQQPLLELDHVRMVFKGRGGFMRKPAMVGAVDDVSLRLEAGEIMAVVGESGCGKTTLGRLVVGLLHPTSGTIRFKGANVGGLRGDAFNAYRKGVQMVHQDSYAALNPARTILQSLSVPLLHHKLVKGKAAARERLEELLTLVGLVPPEQFLDKYPHQLSGGQRQRLLLARALSVQPDLIVADEPVSMVDVSLRISLLDLMSEMNRRFNIAFIYITHDLATARYIASHGRIAVMYPGKVVETGGLNTVLGRPRHPYLQALLAAVPIPDPRIARAMTELPLKSLEMPDPANPPPGCRFHPRCPYAEGPCDHEEPGLAPVDGGWVACHHVERIPRWEWASLSSA